MNFRRRLREWSLDRLDAFDRAAERLREHLRDAARRLRKRR